MHVEDSACFSLMNLYGKVLFKVVYQPEDSLLATQSDRTPACSPREVETIALKFCTDGIYPADSISATFWLFASLESLIILNKHTASHQSYRYLQSLLALNETLFEMLKSSTWLSFFGDLKRFSNAAQDWFDFLASQAKNENLEPANWSRLIVSIQSISSVTDNFIDHGDFVSSYSDFVRSSQLIYFSYILRYGIED